MTRAVRLVSLAASLAFVAACGDDGTSGAADPTGPQGGAGTAAAASGDAVEIKGTGKLVFEPATLTATVGTPFIGRLVQVGSIPHNIQIKDFGVKPGDTLTTKDGEAKEFSFTPSKAGTFEYVCTIHPATMKGTLTVS